MKGPLPSWWAGGARDWPAGVGSCYGSASDRAEYNQHSLPMIRVRSHSTGFRFAGALVLLALLPSFAPDTWGLSCLHHSSHDTPGEHEPAATSEDHSASPEPGYHANAGADARGSRDHAPRPAPTHLAEAFDHGSRHHDPKAPPCTCAGECSTSAGPSSPVPTRVLGLPPAYPESVRLSQASTTPATDRTPYLLPFANAPPLS